jgi:hypothetical protein
MVNIVDDPATAVSPLADDMKHRELLNRGGLKMISHGEFEIGRESARIETRNRPTAMILNPTTKRPMPIHSAGYVKATSVETGLVEDKFPVGKIITVRLFATDGSDITLLNLSRATTWTCE